GRIWKDADVPRLLIIGDDGVERAVELTERTIQIGRGPGNDVVLPDAHKGVSRTHAELRFRNGRCVLVDLQSQNGTFLNGERIEHAEVPFGAEIGGGRYRVRIARGAAPGSPSGAPAPGAKTNPPASRRRPPSAMPRETWKRPVSMISKSSGRLS